MSLSDSIILTLALSTRGSIFDNDFPLRQALTTSVDKLVKAVTDLKTEYADITYKIDRHERWLEQLAEKVGLKLEH